MYRLRSGLSFARDKDGAAVLDTRTGMITTLNETGSFVWQGLVDGKSVSQVVNELAAVTGTEEAVVEHGVHAFLNEPRVIALFEE